MLDMYVKGGNEDSLDRTLTRTLTSMYEGRTRTRAIGEVMGAKPFHGKTGQVVRVIR